MEETPLSDTMDYIRKLINYMELHYMENIMAKDLAKCCELSETHMRRIFLEHTNATPLEYLNLVRINKACELLMKGNCSVESVSEQVGYTVLSTFMRNFKRSPDFPRIHGERKRWKIRKTLEHIRFQYLKDGK